MSIDRKINHYSLNNPASIYNEEALTSLELSARTAGLVNECVDNFNQLESNTIIHLDNQDNEIASRLKAQDDRIATMNDVTMPANVDAEVQERIDNGAFDQSINRYIGNLEGRVDNLLGKVVEGSTTSDAELIDARLMIDGKVATNTGAAVRGQALSLLNVDKDALLAYIHATGKVPTVLHNGFLKVNNYEMSYSDTETYKSRTTPLLPCKEGDVFYYMGEGRSQAVSVVFFNGLKIVSTIQIESNDHYTEVIIPVNIDGVLFSSISNDGVVCLDVKTDYTFTNNIENALGYDVYNLYDPAKASVGFLHKYGHINVTDDYMTSDYIPVKAGESLTMSKYRIMGVFNVNKERIFWTDTEVFEDYTYTASVDGYIRVSFRKSTVPNPIIVRGETITNYQEHQKKLPEDSWFSDKQQAYIDNIQGNTTNVLYGKKYVACGDSFTAGDFTGSTEQTTFTNGLYKGEKMVYPFFIGRRNNMTVINEALNGSTMTNIGNGTANFSISRYKNIPKDTDYITLNFGINDTPSHNNVPMGDIDSTDNATFYGAWNVVLEYLITNHPYAKIGVIIPNGCAVEGDEVIPEAIRQVCAKWGVPYLDMANDPQVPLMFRTNRMNVCEKARELRENAFKVGNGNAHPNQKAHEYESTFIEDFLRRL